MIFREKLKQLRGSMTQEALAAKSGMAIDTIRGYEQGKRSPGFAAVMKLAKAFGHDCRIFADCEDLSDDEPPAKGKKGAKRK